MIYNPFLQNEISVYFLRNQWHWKQSWGWGGALHPMLNRHCWAEGRDGSWGSRARAPTGLPAARPAPCTTVLPLHLCSEMQAWLEHTVVWGKNAVFNNCKVLKDISMVLKLSHTQSQQTPASRIFRPTTMALEHFLQLICSWLADHTTAKSKSINSRNLKIAFTLR